jgi:glycerophosphoryl diester phosphodiesterase
VLFIISNIYGAPEKGEQTVKLLAHRGLAQTFDISKVEWDTNTAAVIYPPEHPYIENTIASMKAAFDYGADIVELDIRVTKDKKLAVFHDYDVGARTEKQGKVSEYTLDELKELDVGYGYTADSGKTYPLRGTGIGLLPSLEEVLESFPQKDLLIHIRDDGKEIGEILLYNIRKMDKDQIKHISIYGNDVAIELIKKEYPEMKSLSSKQIKKAVVEYELIGWLGIIPKSIQNMELHFPIEYARYLWGWPDLFVKRMEKVNTRVVVTLKKGKWSGAFDTQEDLQRVPKNYYGYIWTERIDRISKYINN